MILELSNDECDHCHKCGNDNFTLLVDDVEFPILELCKDCWHVVYNLLNQGVKGI